MNILTCWIGQKDLDASLGKPKAGLGPIANAVDAQEYDLLYLLVNNNYEEHADSYVDWLRSRSSAKIELRRIWLSRPTAHGEIYQAVSREVETLLQTHPKANLTFHLSPGTPAMHAIWIILAETRFPARLIESSLEAGVCTVEFPFELAAEYLTDEKPAAFSESRPPPAPAFADIIHKSDSMRRVLERAQRFADREVPVLIEGATGTGKELLARAIHQAGPRKLGTFHPVNCGAIPRDLVESELFGHTRGAFSGAVEATLGHFRAADGGTLFLDEIGELPLPAQVKLLRAVQEREVVPVGGTKAVPVDVRIIAATNRSLFQAATQEEFRWDLFYRLAVAMLRLPPLRERREDIGLLLDSLLERINRASRSPKEGHKKLALGAKKFMLAHPWHGNVRELESTLMRAHIEASGDTISEDEARAAILSIPPGHEAILGRPLGDGFSIDDVLDEVQKHYIDRALMETDNNKTKTAELLGFPSRQTLDSRLEGINNRLSGVPRKRKARSAAAG